MLLGNEKIAQGSLLEGRMNSQPHTPLLSFTPFVQIRFFVANIIHDLQNSELVTKRTRILWAVLLVSVYLAFVLVGPSPLATGFSADTAWYLQLSPYRQPMYGMWANATYLLFGSWRIVSALQVVAFVSFTAWVIVELALISNLGMLSALFFVAWMLAITRLGLLNLVGSLQTEGLFYPMIMLMAATFLAWVRTRKKSLLVVLALIPVGMTQLRTDALLVAAVPIFAAACVLAQTPMRSAKGRSAILVLTAVITGLVSMPPLLGKSVMQISTAADSLGFAILPRVSLLPISPILGERSPEWTAMSSSWRAAAKQLDSVALTQFDAPLQDAIRYNLGPKILLPAILNRSPKEIEEGWLNGKYFDDAKRIAIEWILDEWPTYIRLSGMHLWGMLTMANFADNADRQAASMAYNAVSSVTWREATWLPNYERLSWSTNIFYLLIRYVSIGVLIVGAIAAVTVLMQMRANREVSPGLIAIALAVGWSIAHSIPAALFVFPDYRYTYANMLVMFSGGAAWLAYLGTNRLSQSRPLPDPPRLRFAGDPSV
jgi:hypothetical protein